jgi:hypothetical protein
MLHIGTLIAYNYAIWGPPFELVEMETNAYAFTFSLSIEPDRSIGNMDDVFSGCGLVISTPSDRTDHKHQFKGNTG